MSLRTNVPDEDLDPDSTSGIGHFSRSRAVFSDSECMHKTSVESPRIAQCPEIQSHPRFSGWTVLALLNEKDSIQADCGFVLSSRTVHC